MSDNLNTFKIMVIALWDDEKTGHIRDMIKHIFIKSNMN